MEKAFFFNNAPYLFGMLFTPDINESKSRGFLIIHPFAEEKKFSPYTC